MSDKLTEAEFLKNYNVHGFPVPLTSVDIAIFSIIDSELKVLMVKRAAHPQLGKWALPGGFIDLQRDRELVDTAKRKLAAKTGVHTPYLEQVACIGNGGRDPRGWAVTIIYMSLISATDVKLQHSDSESDIGWQPVYRLKKAGEIAFDHRDIIHICHDRLKNKVQYTSLPVNLLPNEFTLPQLQSTYEILLNTPIEKKSFRRRILDADILEETGHLKQGPTRPAKLYRAKKHGKDYFFPRNIEGPRP